MQPCCPCCCLRCDCRDECECLECGSVPIEKDSTGSLACQARKCTNCGKDPNWPGPSTCDCPGCNTGAECIYRCYCTEADLLRVENYNLKDHVTRLQIEINRLNQVLKDEGIL